jgi:hypothetical protein
MMSETRNLYKLRWHIPVLLQIGQKLTATQLTFGKYSLQKVTFQRGILEKNEIYIIFATKSFVTPYSFGHN